MSENSNRNVAQDAGMTIYEEIVNSVDSEGRSLDQMICDLKHADANGQFLCSAARFLAAVDREKYAEYLPVLIEGAIEKDRERRYLGQLLKAIWGDDYAERAEELCSSDDLFRRLHKRAFATGTFD